MERAPVFARFAVFVYPPLYGLAAAKKSQPHATSGQTTRLTTQCK